MYAVLGFGVLCGVGVWGFGVWGRLLVVWCGVRGKCLAQEPERTPWNPPGRSSTPLAAAQIGEQDTFISELLNELTITIQDLETHQIHMFYEAVGLMIGADTTREKQEHYLVCILSLYSLFNPGSHATTLLQITSWSEPCTQTFRHVQSFYCLVCILCLYCLCNCLLHAAAPLQLTSWRLAPRQSGTVSFGACLCMTPCLTVCNHLCA